MAVLPQSGYGVVVLLNAGSGLLLDQTGIFYGVRSIVEGTDPMPAGPAGATFNATHLDTFLGLLTLLVALLGARGALRASWWVRGRSQQEWTWTAIRAARLAWLRLTRPWSSPSAAERLVGGRWVTWEEAAYGWPALTVLGWTLLAALLATWVACAWRVVQAPSPPVTPELVVASVVPDQHLRRRWRLAPADSPP